MVSLAWDTVSRFCGNLKEGFVDHKLATKENITVIAWAMNALQLSELPSVNGQKLIPSGLASVVGNQLKNLESLYAMSYVARCGVSVFDACFSGRVVEEFKGFASGKLTAVFSGSIFKACEVASEFFDFMKNTFNVVDALAGVDYKVLGSFHDRFAEFAGACKSYAVTIKVASFIFDTQSYFQGGEKAKTLTAVGASACEAIASIAKLDVVAQRNPILATQVVLIASFAASTLKVWDLPKAKV